MLKIRIYLLLAIISLFFQYPAVSIPQADHSPEISISLEEGNVNISINLNESFRWIGTRFESIKKFPQPWMGLPDLPHEIWFEKVGVMTWRQTDMMFVGDYVIKETSAKELLIQYNEKHGGFGIRSWSVNKDGNLKSFNESTGSYEVLTPKVFAKRFGLDFYLDEYSIEASVRGYLLGIIGEFNIQNNLLSFDRLDYKPFFLVPSLEIEESINLRDWSKTELLNKLPSEYEWPQGLSLDLGNVSTIGKFYRVKVLKD